MVRFWADCEGDLPVLDMSKLVWRQDVCRVLWVSPRMELALVKMR